MGRGAGGSKKTVEGLSIPSRIPTTISNGCKLCALGYPRHRLGPKAPGKKRKHWHTIKMPCEGKE